ncbi:hypothetical protein [Gaoshiqia sp. Z1-71]|uniref:hypothetical protein n=1 Tax=Gaoshiqia hydrogeniformans TaxID=3290090 RepID=UPI003BF85FB9
MKKITIVSLSLFLTVSGFAQFNKENSVNVDKNEIHTRFDKRKDKGYYSIMQVSLLLGNNQSIQGIVNYYPYPTADTFAPVYSYPYPYSRTGMAVAPSFTITNGYLFNEHWAAGAGVGYEIFDHNLFPLFAELRYTFWDTKISPVVAMKGGYAFGNFKAKHYDDLYLNWSPYHVNDASLRNYGGLMLHPEIGVKMPLNENSDLLITAAYRHQKTKSVARKDYGSNQFDEWEHKEDLSRLSFGVAIMFR